MDIAKLKYFFLIGITVLFMNSCSSSKSNSTETGARKMGNFENKKKLDSLLTAYSKREVDSNQPHVVVYYPGDDPCNLSGSSTRESTKAWYTKMEVEIHKVAPANIFYVYKDSTGLYGRHDGFKEWFQDPKEVFEDKFQKPHICGGYILIAPNGEFVSHASEFDQASLKKQLKDLIN